MELIEAVIQRTVEKLYEDEQLRSNLNDEEAKVVLGWAEDWLTAQISAADDENRARQIAQNEWTRVRHAVSTINALAAQPGALRLSEAVAAFEPHMQVASILPRERVFKLLTQFIATLWQTQTERATTVNRSPQ